MDIVRNHTDRLKQGQKVALAAADRSVIIPVGGYQRIGFEGLWAFRKSPLFHYSQAG